MLLAFFLKGVAVGVIIAIPVGPVGVLCVRRTIFQGKLAGLASGLGAASADALFGAIAGFGLGVVSDLLLDYQDWLRIAGAGFLLYVGAAALLREPQPQPTSRGTHESLLRDFASTFALTLTNPITILAFVGIFAAVGLTGANATLGRGGMLVLGVWCGSLLWWLALSVGAGLFARSCEPHHLSWINRGSAGILVLSGAGLLAAMLIRHFG